MPSRRRGKKGAGSCRNVLQLPLPLLTVIDGGLEQGGGSDDGRVLHRQRELLERRQVVKIVRGDGAPSEPVDPQHEVTARDLRVVATLDVGDERLVAAEPRGQLLLCPILSSAPLGQPHLTHPISSNSKRYIGASYFGNGHYDRVGAVYHAMAYSVLVMRPGNRLRLMRKRAGLRQEELAERSGATQGAISNYENGRRPLTLDWMRTFARILDCSVADLLDDQDIPERLADDERELVHRYRHSDPRERATIQRVTAAVSSYRDEPPEEEAA